MPIYAYRCEPCEHDFDVRKSFAEYNTPESCPECGKEARKLVTAANVVFKGDGWTSKNGRIAGQMRDKNQRLKAKEEQAKRDGVVPQLAPNVDGERTSSWDDAAKLAASKGKDTSGYKKMAAKEKASKKKSNP